MHTVFLIVKLNLQNMFLTADENPQAVPADSDMTKKETRWGPSVRSWFMKPINYSHMLHEP